MSSIIPNKFFASLTLEWRAATPGSIFLLHYAGIDVSSFASAGGFPANPLTFDLTTPLSPNEEIIAVHGYEAGAPPIPVILFVDHITTTRRSLIVQDGSGVAPPVADTHLDITFYRRNVQG